MKNPKNLENILAILGSQKNVLHEKYGVLSLAIFGSYARNEQKSKSDIDVFVELKREHLTFDNFMELRFFLEASHPNIGVRTTRNFDHTLFKVLNLEKGSF